MTYDHVAQSDPEVASALAQELARQRETIELIASENIVSPAVLEAVGSVLTNKYAEGYPRHRYYGGCEKVDLVEDLARDRACKLFRLHPCQRATAFRGECQSCGIHRAHRARRHGHWHEPRSGRAFTHGSPVNSPGGCIVPRPMASTL